MASSATIINTETPKNGARHDCSPSRPPTNGPEAMPMPSAASNRMIAWAVEPTEAETIVESAVATNRALPRPHPARNPTI